MLLKRSIIQYVRRNSTATLSRVLSIEHSGTRRLSATRFRKFRQSEEEEDATMDIRGRVFENFDRVFSQNARL